MKENFLSVSVPLSQRSTSNKTFMVIPYSIANQISTKFRSSISTLVFNPNPLTHNTPLIHTSFTYSKLNMDEICGLKFYLLYVLTYITKNIFEIPPCARPFSDLPCWLSQFSKTKLRQPTGQTWKRPCAWRNFKNIFSRPLFTIIFRPKILILDTYSILGT